MLTQPLARRWGATRTGEGIPDMVQHGVLPPLAYRGLHTDPPESSLIARVADLLKPSLDLLWRLYARAITTVRDDVKVALANGNL